MAFAPVLFNTQPGMMERRHTAAHEAILLQVLCNHREVQKASINLVDSRQELGVRRSTTVPAWWALWILVKYRSSRNFRSGAYLGARLGTKLAVILQQRVCC